MVQWLINYVNEHRLDNDGDELVEVVIGDNSCIDNQPF